MAGLVWFVVDHSSLMAGTHGLPPSQSASTWPVERTLALHKQSCCSAAEDAGSLRRAIGDGESMVLNGTGDGEFFGSVGYCWLGERYRTGVAVMTSGRYGDGRPLWP